MNGWKHERTIDLSKDQTIGAMIRAAHRDAKSNEWIVHVMNDGSDVDLSGYTARSAFLRSDGATVFADAEIEGSSVVAIIPALAYSVAGSVFGTITLIDNDQRITIDTLVIDVYIKSSEVVAPDDHLVLVSDQDLETKSQSLTGAINELLRKLITKQDELVSGGNIKTINGETILGAGDIIIGSKINSVNGKTGTVILNASDVGALPSNTKIPSKTSDLENDSKFVKEDQIPTKTSDLINDSEFVTTDQIPTKTSDLENDDRFITESDVPVKSVNGKTGSIELTPSDLGIGTVFTLKGSVATVDDLPDSGNEIGDVYYVVAESVGYIWLNDGSGDRWEQLGLSIDLSAYAKQTDLDKTNEDLRKESASQKDALLRVEQSKIDKPRNTPAVGKVLKITAVNEDGSMVCEWAEDEKGISLEDIPVAKFDDKPDNHVGLLSVDPYNPFYTHNGKLYFQQALDSNIANKNNGNRPLVSTQINPLVRVGLIDNPLITDADKPLICKTIGAMPVPRWRDVERIYLKDVVDEVVSKSAEPDGTPYNFRALRYFIAIHTNTGAKDYGVVRLYNGNEIIGRFEHGNVTNGNNYWLQSRGIYSIDDPIGSYYSRWDSTGSGTTAIYSRCPINSVNVGYLGGGTWDKMLPVTRIDFCPINGANASILIQAIDW